MNLHCSKCWVIDSRISSANFIYEGRTLCRAHMIEAWPPEAWLHETTVEPAETSDPSPSGVEFAELDPKGTKS